MNEFEVQRGHRRDECPAACLADARAQARKVVDGESGYPDEDTWPLLSCLHDGA